MADDLDRRALAKVARRLFPFIFILYIVCFLDRVNVSFAQLQMGKDLGIDERTYGLGAGIFFIGYFFFEVPSNVVLQRVGARLWITRIMVTWGLIAAAMMFVRGAVSLCAMRFLLGVAEAGFYPGILFYLTTWFPQAERARAIATFSTAAAIAGTIGGPISGKILTLHGVWHLAGWQWLFVLEGVPSMLLGIVVFFYLTDGPEQAHWLTADERQRVRDMVARDCGTGEDHGAGAIRHVIRSPQVWQFAALYFLIVLGNYGVGLWLPQIVKKGFPHESTTVIGILSALPFLVAAIGMVLVGRHSDRTRERRWHVAVPVTVGALGLTGSALVHSPWPALLLLCLAALGNWSAIGPFWAMPTSMLRGTTAAAGIAMVNSVGNLAGFAGPYVVGWVKQATGSFTGGLLTLAVSLICAAGVALAARHKPGLEVGRVEG